jgi:hypothetical protein
MPLPLSPTDVTITLAAEADIKTALTTGLSNGLTTDPPVYTPASNYTPSTAPTVPRDMHRGIAAGIIRALRTFPVCLPMHVVADVPPASAWPGAIIYVSNGAAGAPILAFSNGFQWLRSDTGTPLS